MRLYRSYNFVDKDPVIDVMRTMVDGAKKPLAKIHDESGVSVTTLRGWFTGKTRRPQFATVAAVTRALGHEITLGGRRVRPLKVVKSRKRKAG